MNQQLMLFTFAVFALVLLINGANTGNPFAHAFAGAVSHPARNWFAQAYERAALWFDKDANEVLEEFKKKGQEFKDDLKKTFNEALKATEGKASQEDLDALKKELTKKADDMQNAFDELQTKANRLNTQQEQTQSKSLMSQAEEGVIKLKEQLKAKGISFKELWNRGQSAGQEVTIDLKSVSNMTRGYALTGANSNLLMAFDMEPGVAKSPTAPYFVTDLISTGATDKPTIYWTERLLLEGGAGQVAEAAHFPQLSGKYGKFSQTAKKTAAYSKITEEAVEDTDFMLSEIQDEIVNGPNSIRNTLENQLLTGDGTGENHKGIFNYARPFAVPTGFQTLTNPNDFDALKAAVLQIVKANYQGTAVLVNPSNLVNMELIKDANGNYIIPPFVGQNGMVIAGLPIIANNRVAENSYLAGNFKLAKLFINRQLNLKFFDQNEDDALNDLRTITGSIRGMFRLKGPDTYGFVAGTFSDTKTKIKTV